MDKNFWLFIMLILELLILITLFFTSDIGSRAFYIITKLFGG